MQKNGPKKTVSGFRVRLPKFYTRKLLGNPDSQSQLWSDGNKGYVTSKEDAFVFSTIEEAVVKGVHGTRTGYKKLNAIWREGARPEANMVDTEGL